jgi:putative spermidine/putrescine transport system permease protein/spermidine/putrescine transport system permease protein
MTAIAASDFKAGDLNSRGLARDERAERWLYLGLCSPALLVVLLLLCLPIGWLFWLSFIGEQDQFTLENYTRIWTEGAYVAIFATTFKVSLLVTGVCLLLGYPVAYCLSHAPRRFANLLLICVLVPFWTSLLVRTYAWLVLLQRKGLINSALVDLGLIEAPIPLVNNMTGTVIGMVHIMLPFLVLPLYASMRGIDGSYLRAAANLGASPTRAFWQIFFPLSLPGLIAGLVLTFILCIGFFITPAVLGGGKVQMIAQRIENSVNLYPTWGPASALGVVLLLLTLLALLASHWAVKRWRRRIGMA